MNNREELQKNALASLRANNYNGGLLLTMRSGKTKVIINAIQEFKPKKVLWFTPLAQLRDVDIPYEFNKWKAKTIFDKNVNVQCHAMANKISRQNYDLVVIDEVQLFSIRNYEFFTRNTVNRIIVATGTWPKSRLKQWELKKLGVHPVHKLDIDAAVTKSIVAPYNIEVIYTELDNTEKYILNKSSGKMQTERTRYKALTYVIDSILERGGDPSRVLYARTALMYNLRSKKRAAQRLLEVLPQEERGLIFCARKAIAENLCDNYYHSTSGKEMLTQFINQDINRLSVVNAANTGLTFHNMDFAIILQANRNKTGDFDQRLGRIIIPRKGYVAQLYLLCARNTIDEVWVNKSLEFFDKNKISYVT